MITALVHELELRQSYLNGEAIQTIYFGGGTPSLISPNYIDLLLKKASQFLKFDIKNCLEITLEANPDDLTNDNLENWKKAGISRLSVGVQSFDDVILKQLNRSHTAINAINGINLAREIGINKISLDLIYGIQNQSLDSLNHSLEIAISLKPQHISAYALTVEHGTALANFIAKGKESPVNENTQAEHFEIVSNFLQKVGYIHYETSNFSLPGHEAMHNTSYWKSKSYLGIGPSAHSYNKISRQWNISNNPKYIQLINQKIIPASYEYIDLEMQWNEFIMVSLRLEMGVEKKEIIYRFGLKRWEKIIYEVQKWDSDNYLLYKNTLKLTQQGRVISDQLVLSLFN